MGREVVGVFFPPEVLVVLRVLAAVLDQGEGMEMEEPDVEGGEESFKDRGTVLSDLVSVVFGFHKVDFVQVVAICVQPAACWYQTRIWEIMDA